MALGIARMFNIELTNNFNYPYLANSIADFWRRWHISFSRWILDYIFKPLQMSMRDWRTLGTAIALIITFLISGLWHGASWGFIIWGLLHGVYLALSVFSQPLLKKANKKLGLEKTKVFTIWQRVTTFNLVCFAWIFFRANNTSDAFYIVTHLLNGISIRTNQLKDLISPILLGQGGKAFLLLLVSIGFIEFLQFVQQNGTTHHRFSQWSIWLRWVIYYATVIFILCFGIFGGSKFIYFQKPNC